MDEHSHSRIATEAADHVRAIVAAAEGEAARILEAAERAAEDRTFEAEAEADRILRDAASRADALVDERRARLSQLSQEIVRRTDELLARVDDAARIRSQFVELSRGLADAAKRVAGETARRADPPRESLPTLPDAPSSEQPSADVPEPTQAAADPEPPAEEPAAPEPAVAGPVETTPPAEPAGVVRIPRLGRAAPVASQPQVAPAPPVEDEPQVPDAETDRFDGARLVALQMAVAGSTRSEVEHHLRRSFGLADPSRILDDVYGKGAPKDKRLSRSGPRRHAG